jgi:hypothetical protein
MKLYKKLIQEKIELNIYYSDEDLIFLFDEIDSVDIKIYKLFIIKEELCTKNDDFYLFKTNDKLIQVFNSCIESKNYSIKIEKNNVLIFEIKDILFNNGSIKIEIPEINNLLKRDEKKKMNFQKKIFQIK